MKFHLIATAVASIFLGFASQSFAQSNDGRSFTHGESKRCESMSGAAKDQCDKEEATKTQGPAAQEPHQPAATQSERSSAGSTAGGKNFTHGESKRCEALSGADKDQCDKEEATKSEASK